MKNIFIFVLAMFSSSVVFAQNDRSQVLIRCKEVRPTVSRTKVTVSSPGVAGRHILTVTRGLRRPEVNSYLVEPVISRGRAGAPMVYVGRGVRLTINVRPGPNGRLSVLRTRSGGIEDLNCRLL